MRGIKKAYKEVEPEKKTSLKRYTYYGWITLKRILKISNMNRLVSTDSVSVQWQALVVTVMKFPVPL
jgi:hypothetical protein